VTWVSLSTDQAECQNQVSNQFSAYINKGFTILDFDYNNNIGTWGLGGVFFHDKLYISENKAYIGGQNTSGSSSIDFGISFTSQSPLYQDLNTRRLWFESSGTVTMNFKYTSQNPYKAQDGSSYFISVSPTWPTCPKSPQYCPVQNYYCSTWFPEKQCNLGNDTGPYRTNTYTTQNPAGFPVGGSPKGNVSYERNHLINLIKNARKFLRITSFDFSMLSSMLSYGGWDKDLEDAFLKAGSSGVQTDIWINQQPFNDTIYAGNVTCDFMRCPEGKAFLSKMNNFSNVKFHWWYQNPPPTDPNAYPECNTLHAKIHYSDWGILISSANLTPDYFGNTSNISLSVIFDQTIPEWISVGVENIFGILTDKSQIPGGGTCDNQGTLYNFQKVNDIRCSQTGCVNTCQACGSSTYGSCSSQCHN
jgi:hypothetical protein